MTYYILKNEKDGRYVRSIDRSGPKPKARYMQPDDPTELPNIYRESDIKRNRTLPKNCKFVAVEIKEIEL